VLWKVKLWNVNWSTPYLVWYGWGSIYGSVSSSRGNCIECDFLCSCSFIQLFCNTVSTAKVMWHEM